MSVTQQATAVLGLTPDQKAAAMVAMPATDAASLLLACSEECRSLVLSVMATEGAVAVLGGMAAEAGSG